MLTNVRISERISSSVPTPSTRPVFSLWNFAEDVSHLSTVFPGIAFGEFTNNFAFFSSINVKSVRAGTQVPKIAVICGITPDASDCFKYNVPNASSASVAS